MKTLVIGLGNPILGDDGVGWHVAEEIATFEMPNSDFEIDCLSLGGLSLMERIIGYKRVILIDSMVTGEHPIGQVLYFTLLNLPDRTAGHTTAAHDTSLLTALRVGKQMGAELPDPENIWVVGIEAQPVYDFSDELSPPVAAAIPLAVEMVVAILKE
jgi:hydrogenase maturation protease